MNSEKTLRDVLRAALEARAAGPVAARHAALLGAFQQIDREAAAGWRGGVLAALDVVVGVVARSSRIGQAQGSLFGEVGWWLGAVPAEVSRAEGAACRAATADGGMVVLVDDAGEERRIIAMIADAPAVAPVMVVIDRDGGPAIEIDPEMIEEAGRCRLRYEAVVRPGAYRVAFGNPRGAGDDGV